MAVPILAVAFSVYILGISVVLFLRPKLMFRPGGTWKEFGVGRGENYTVIPFWLFAIFWAFISYGVGLVVMSLFANMAMSAFPEQPPAPTMMPVSQQPSMSQMMHSQQMTHAPQMTSPMQQIQQQAMPGPAPETFMKPVSSLIGIPSNQPGFYVLQNNGGPGGPPQYVYYGTSPPPLPR